MKAIRLILILAVVLMGAVNAQAEKKGEKTITFNANLHCNSCKAKVEKNIPFEKGVKDLKIDMEKQTITVTFRGDKNNAEICVRPSRNSASRLKTRLQKQRKHVRKDVVQERRNRVGVRGWSPVLFLLCFRPLF